MKPYLGTPMGHLLKLLTGLTILLLLAACGDTGPAPTRSPSTPSPLRTQTGDSVSRALTQVASNTPSEAERSTVATPAPTPPAAPSGTAPAATAAVKPTQAAASGGSVTLQMWVMPNTAHSVDDMNRILAGFYRQYPDIKVNVTEVSWNDALVKITTALQNGTGPDVTQAGTTWVGGFQATGGLRPFTASEIEMVGGSGAFNEASWDTTHLIGSKDIVALPWFAETRALFYRTDLLKKAGLDPATAFKDWDTFAASLAKMRDVETGLVRAPFAITGKNDWNVVHNPMPFLWGAGGNILTADGVKASINSPEALKGLSYYAGLYNQGLTLKEALGKNMSDLELLWSSGELGSFIGLPSVIANSKKARADNGYAGTVTAKNMGTAMLPAGPQGVKAFVGGSDLVIPKTSQHQEAAVKLVQYLVSKGSQLDYQAIAYSLPTNKEAQADPFYTGNPLYRPFLEQLKAGNGKSYPEVAAWNGIESSLQKNFSLMWDDVAAGKGDTAIKAHLDSAAQEIAALLAASR